MSKREDMPAEMTDNDYQIAGDACLAQARHHRSDGEYREALRFAVTGLKVYAHVRGFNGEVESNVVDLYAVIEGCSATKKALPDAVIQDNPAAQS